MAFSKHFTPFKGKHSELFRPCIDIHEGRVKQIVGATLSSNVEENYVASEDIEYFADHYAQYNLHGGHMIMLDRKEETQAAARRVVEKYPNTYQVGGGMTLATGKDWLEWGADKIILSSDLFSDGKFQEQHLEKVARAWGRNHLVVDLSSLKVGEEYRTAIHGWKTITDFILSPESLSRVGNYCEEILIHAISEEGRRGGLDERLLSLLEDCGETCSASFVYAGGIHSLNEVKMICERSHHLGRKGGKIAFTIGSALDIFGGNIPLKDVLQITHSYQNPRSS